MTVTVQSRMQLIYLAVLWYCWLGGRKGIWPVKTEWWGAGMAICLERSADLHMAQLMPLPLTVSSFCKIQTGFTFLVPGVCVCVCVHSQLIWTQRHISGLYSSLLIYCLTEIRFLGMNWKMDVCARVFNILYPYFPALRHRYHNADIDTNCFVGIFNIVFTAAGKKSSGGPCTSREGIQSFISWSGWQHFSSQSSAELILTIK